MDAPDLSAETGFRGLRVLEPGLYTLIVDFGRPRTRSLGVPVGGAADRTSLALGNALVGNPVDAPALEMSLAGPFVEATCELACVVYGAAFSLHSDCRPWGILQAGKTFTLAAGERLHVEGPSRGMRAYLCVRGGLGANAILGSRSSLVPLAAGAELACQPSRIRARYFPSPFAPDSEAISLRVLPGPQSGWFDLADFVSREFTVGQASNRMGIRLQSTTLSVPARQLTSEPVCPGAVQVTSDGQCIILGVDGQTIGGYPKIAQVISADLDRVGQFRPGERIGFQTVSLNEACKLHRKKNALLNKWVVRLQNSFF